jgi:hypothetical protein
MLGYDYDIIYKKGKGNVVVDALSINYDEEGSIFSFPFLVLDFPWVVHQEFLEDANIMHMIHQLQVVPQAHLGYNWKDNEFHYKVHIVLV